jgi:hypothetical protein
VWSNLHRLVRLLCTAPVGGVCMVALLAGHIVRCMVLIQVALLQKVQQGFASSAHSRTLPAPVVVHSLQHAHRQGVYGRCSSRYRVLQLYPNQHARW